MIVIAIYDYSRPELLGMICHEDLAPDNETYMCGDLYIAARDNRPHPQHTYGINKHP